MANFLPVERDQLYLMPPSVAEWLPTGHLAWFVLELVGELDLGAFEGAYRDDGRGGAAYDPAVMVGLLIYAYCVGERSSRRIERRCVEDVAFRVLAANQSPDHATLARFRRRHRQAIGALFSQVLGLCVRAGLVDAGLVAIDSTRLEANASGWSNRTRREIAEEILDEAEAVDAAEDERFGDRRGDELPGEWADRRDRRARLREALRQLDTEDAGGTKPPKERRINTTDPDSRLIPRRRRGMVQGYNAQAAVTGDQVMVAAEIATTVTDRTQFIPMLGAVEAELAAAGFDGAWGTVVADSGYWSAGNATVEGPAEVLIGVQATNNSAMTDDDPRVKERPRVLERLDRGEISERAAAKEMGVAPRTAQTLLAAYREGRPDPTGVRIAMRAKLATPEGAAAYSRRQTSIEPVFGNIKANRGYGRFSVRGLKAVSSEWKLICATNNVLKLWRSQPAIA